MREFVEKIEKLWCEHMHAETMWPIHGTYRCGKCLREYAVGFELPEQQAAMTAAVSATFVEAR